MKRKLQICFTSDIHGYLYPETYADKSRTPLGLLAGMRRYKKDGNTLILDGGDMLQGSALAMYCQKFQKDPSALAEAMNRAGYDFVTIGNHDFNYGYEYLTAYLRKLRAQVLCANVKLMREADRELIRPYEIVTLENGLRVAVIGIVTDYVNVWEQPENLREIRVTDQDLLSVTGGIVQGMSGSPILQDGKLVGAVTHVFVSDPARGYGIFIENMLKNVE